MLNILIYEKNINKCKKIINSIAHLNFHVKICNIATSASEINENLISSNIDLIILDIIDENFPYTNLIQEKNFANSNTSVIVLSDEINTRNNNSSNIIFINNYELLYDKLLYFSSKYNLKSIISKELDYLCFNANHIGTKCLIEVIYQVYYNYAHLSNLTKSVYPQIAKKHSISINTLKCDIFQSALYSYVTCEESKLEAYLGRSCIEKPSVKNYIYSILEHIKLGTQKDSVPNRSPEDHSII